MADGMDEKDRWSIHLEYLKMAIALATALIAAGAAIYVDASKIPTDSSRYVLLSGIGTFFVALLCSVYSIARLANHFLHLPQANVPDPTVDKELEELKKARTARANSVTRWANASFVCLGLGAALLGAFFGIRTFTAGTPFEQAIATANASSTKLVNTSKGESARLKSVEVQTDTFRVTYEVAPGGASIVVVTDSLGTNLKTATRL
jgi:hypothetical protein